MVEIGRFLNSARVGLSKILRRTSQAYNFVLPKDHCNMFIGSTESKKTSQCFSHKLVNEKCSNVSEITSLETSI